MFKLLHFLSHGVTLIKPLSRQYYTMFIAIFLRLREFVKMTDLCLFLFSSSIEIGSYKREIS